MRRKGGEVRKRSQEGLERGVNPWMGASMAYDPKGLFLQAMALIDQKPWIRLGAVTRSLGVERHTVEKAFRLNTGKSFRAVRHGSLCRRAVQLFSSRGSASNSEVAFALGYESERAFARFIRGSFGWTPSELRRRLRGSDRDARRIRVDASRSAI